MHRCYLFVYLFHYIHCGQICNNFVKFMYTIKTFVLFHFTYKVWRKNNIFITKKKYFEAEFRRTSSNNIYQSTKSSCNIIYINLQYLIAISFIPSPILLAISYNAQYLEAIACTNPHHLVAISYTDLKLSKKFVYNVWEYPRE